MSAEKFTWRGNKGVQNLLQLNVQSMQILSLCLCFSFLPPQLLSQKYYFLYLANQILYRPLLRQRRAFVRHLCLPLTLSLALSLLSPMQGESGPTPCWEYANHLCLQTPTPPRKAVPTPHRLLSSFPSDLLILPHLPPKALGFSFLKCGLKIIFGKLTALSLQFPPTSKKKE